MQVLPREHEAPEQEHPFQAELTPPEQPSVRRPWIPIKRAWLRRTVIGVMACILLMTCVFMVYYIRLARVIDKRLAAGPFSSTVDIFAAPRVISVGDPLSADQIAAQLRRSGYSADRDNPIGSYTLGSNSLAITPGEAARGASTACVLEFTGGKISRIRSVGQHGDLRAFELEPQLIANLSDARERRRIVRFADIPPRLVQAVISVEDKRFFAHSGFDPLRMIKAAWVDVKSGRKQQGASTLTMQLARNFWLEPAKRWKRKIEELTITLHMERKLTKQQIFEYYANQVYLGRRDTFSISGFAEGAQAYFNKDLSLLNDSEVAMLAGLVQRPSYYNPYRNPERARRRRDIVLNLMRQNGYLTDSAYRAAVDTPLRLRSEHSDAHQSQYFVDLLRDEMHKKHSATEEEGRRIYTTLDADLQEAAEASVRMGMEKVDKLLRARKASAIVPGQPQVALIALDPHTGEVKAVVGGRDYGASQLNHALAMRQPGSVFKPFVYAAALNTAVEGGSEVFTPASMINDEPTTFYSAGQIYEPRNFHGEAMGDITLRDALAHSVNVATVSLAGRVGYDRVLKMARRAGLNDAVKATPAMALGAYEATPLEIAGAYTTFANQGMRVTPTLVAEVASPSGSILYRHQPESRQALDPRVAYLMVSMMQDVLKRGTGAGVYSMGFTQPAAGKTGTSRDGWFAGFTSQLLCVVWVGFDDNRDLNLEGARSALPIWAEFMKRASKVRPYNTAEPFKGPGGIQSAQICTESGKLPGPFCTKQRTDVFVAGTAPKTMCDVHQPPEIESPQPGEALLRQLSMAPAGTIVK